MTNATPNASDDKILDRIRALLAKAESTEFTAEAEAYTAKATELIAKYGIDAALLAAQNGQPGKPADLIIPMHAPYVMDKATLLQTIAHALGCKAILLNEWDGNGGRVYRSHLFGFQSDLDRVEMLYTSLLVQAAHALGRETVPERARRSTGSVAAWRRSWYAGFGDTIGKRLRAAEAAAKATATADRQTAAAGSAGPSVALVLADRSALVSRAYTDAYPRARTQSRSYSGSGAGAGRAAGERAHLGGRSVGSGGRSAIGG